MKRMNLLFSVVTIVAATALCVGCKDKGDAADKTDAATVAAEEGAAALEAADWARAYDKFSDAIAANDQDVDSYYGRAAAATQIAQGHYSLAKAAATNQNEEAGIAEAEKADQYFKLAIEDCDRIVAIDQNFADAYFLKGTIAQYQGAWEDGIEAFTQCVKLDPENAEAYHRRGEIYDHTGDYMNSSVDFKKASELGFSEGLETAEAGSGDLEDFSDLEYDGDDAAAEEVENN